MTTDPSIHRLLDEAFAGVAMTPDLQDLKEELHGSLAGRVAELEAQGADSATAAATAIREVGDIRALIAAVAGADPASAGPDLGNVAELMRRHRVRPAPSYVIRTVLLALVVTAAIAVLALAALRLLEPDPVAGMIVAGILALAVGAIVADALRQDTTVHFPSPLGRAVGWGAAGGALAAGLGLGAVYVARPDAVAILIVAIVLTLAGILGLTWSGVTQTNRAKPWALEMGRQAVVEDRFSRDPAAAARFGIYTVVIWIAGIAVFVALSLTVGFAWSWLAIVAAVLVFFVVLARMNFPAAARSDRQGRPMR
jgi:hypothetical protein